MKEKKKHLLFTRTNLTVRLLFVFMLIFPLTGSQVFSQTDRKVTVQVRKASIRTALDQLKKSTQMHFMYEEEVISDTQTVTLEYENAPLTSVLDDLCKQTLLSYEVRKNVILLFQSKKQKTKQKDPDVRISGRVIDDYGEGLIGVNIKISGTSTGTITDVNGEYQIVAAPEDVLLFSYIGMENKLVKVQSGMQTVDVRMITSRTALGEVVVTGYQTLSRERATGAYAVISEKDTKGKLETDIMSRIEGQVAGMNKTGYGNDFSIRGITTFEGSQAPLFVVDGLPFEGDIASINPSDVQNITVLKDATAASIYGAQSANGVIVITTKRGQVGSTGIVYSGSVKFTPKPDLGYLNLINSSELVDLEIEGFNYYHPEYQYLNRRYARSPVIDILYRHENGEITDLEKALSPYRNWDNRRQIEKEFARTGLSHQHNLAISGGTEISRYMFSLNYMKEMSNQKYEYNDRIGFNIKNDTKFFDWLHADIGASGNFSRTDNKNSSYSEGSSTQGGSYVDLIYAYPSYYMLRDTDNTPLPWQRGKSEYELERLRAMGLMDETYSPVTNKQNEKFHSNTNYYRIHAGLLFHLTEGLSANLKYQTEGSYHKGSKMYSRNSWMVRNMINEAATYDSYSGELTLNVPKGGQLDEVRQEDYSYTFRAQMNYDRTFGIHDISAIAGAERRLRRSTGTRVYYMGYDENSLVYSPYDPMTLADIDNTESMYGSFGWLAEDYNGQSHREDRYVSFYGNASYTYDNRYSATGSIRIDKSDLYATDSKKQNRPLWSIGGSWNVSEEKNIRAVSWINLLKLRATYGIGGNIPKEAGPYMNIIHTGYNYWIGDTGAYISNPPNPLLRWEKTATTNVGIDFALLQYRLSGSVNYYNKKTTDLLGRKNIDSTLGWSSPLLINYGEMNNKGVEFELQSVNIHNKNFNWQTNLLFSYNKNKLINLEGTQESVFSYTAYDVAAVGYPLNSLFSFRYAGLDPNSGDVLIYTKDGDIVDEVESIDDLVYSGTRTPKYTASLRNSLTFSNFNLSFMFVYYGGHVMRDVVSEYLTDAPRVNLNRKALNHWRKPGDEEISGIAPSINGNIYYYTAQPWYSADIHVKKADYIKLRDVSLSYAVPKEWLRKYSLKSLMLTCQVSNLWWWAKNGDIDPESYHVGGYGTGVLSLPNPTTYTFGVTIDF